MKSFPLYIFIAAGLYAQGQPPAAPPAAPAPEPAPETVIASFEGKKLTYGELKKFMIVLPPQQQQMAMSNPKLLVHQYFLWQRLAAQAVQEKLINRARPRSSSNTSARIFSCRPSSTMSYVT